MGRGQSKLDQAMRAIGCLALTGPLNVALAGAGDHIQVGQTVIAPELTTGVEFRTNTYLSVGAVQSTAPRDKAVPSFNFVLRPSLGIHTSGDKAKFDFDGAYELRKWFDPEIAQNLDRFSDFFANVSLDVLPKAPVGFTISENAVARNRESDNPYLGSALLTQLRSDLTGLVNIRVGPEFAIQPGFSWAWHNYRVPGADVQRSLSTRQTFMPQLNVHWNFFPNTALVVETQYHLNRWSSNWIATNTQVEPVVDAPGSIRSYGEYLAMPNSDFFKGMAGIRGRVTRDLVVVLEAGWGSARYDMQSVAEESASDPGLGSEADPVGGDFNENIKGIDGLLVLAKADIDAGFDDLRPFGQKLSFFYRKDFQDSFFTNYVHQNHVRFDLNSRWGRFLRTAVGASVRFEEYAGEVDRRDIYLRADGTLYIDPTKYLGFDLGVFWTQRASSQNTIQYDNVQARALIRFQY